MVVESQDALVTNRTMGGPGRPNDLTSVAPPVAHLPKLFWDRRLFIFVRAASPLERLSKNVVAKSLFEIFSSSGCKEQLPSWDNSRIRATSQGEQCDGRQEHAKRQHRQDGVPIQPDHRQHCCDINNCRCEDASPSDQWRAARSACHAIPSTPEATSRWPNLEKRQRRSCEVHWHNFGRSTCCFWRRGSMSAAFALRPQRLIMYLRLSKGLRYSHMRTPIGHINTVLAPALMPDSDAAHRQR
mmetsp:Transcript_37053/g.85572  ORF Transcript_37053/g.85572 Transcript_37053/m.85572 type:complete len:242 (+) Transcript_37053:449-1174(+)